MVSDVDKTVSGVLGYRAGAPVHRGLTEGLSHGEGDVGGADAGGGLDGQGRLLLTDLHRGPGGCCHRYLPQEHIHTWRTPTAAHTHTQPSSMMN